MDRDIISVLYQDDSIIIVDKPSGLLSVPGKETQDSVVSRVRALINGCIDHPEVHRLDMDTSGVMVLALTQEAHRELSNQFQNRLIKKRYVALLDGIVEHEQGRIELPFRLDYERRPLQVYDEENGKLGITEWKKLSQEDNLTRVDFFPITGRTHQLRVHSAHEKGLGCPIVGDTLYGNHPRHGELKLHATELVFTHPISEKEVLFSSEPRF